MLVAIWKCYIIIGSDIKKTTDILYYNPVPKVDDTVMMNRIYDVWCQSPCFGYRRVAKLLRREGMFINRKKVRRLMNLMGLKVIFTGAKTLAKYKSHKIYNYLLKRPSNNPPQSSLAS